MTTTAQGSLTETEARTLDRYWRAANYLAVGQIYLLANPLLTATARGDPASPLTQPLETADAWLVRDPRAGHEQPQMILRIGYGLPVPPAPRRPVSQVLN